MKNLRILAATVLAAIAVAITYYYFEAAVRHSINYTWDTLLNTGTRRILVIPTCVIISLVFFGVQHHFDQPSETKESEGLGDAPKPTLINFIKVLCIGFFSLVAGASLGPEAILVPACLIVGGLIGSKLFKGDKQSINLLSMVGFVALFAAFFNSFIFGMLGLLLMTKQVKVKLNAPLILIAAIASLVTVLALKVLSSSAYTKLPQTKLHVSLIGSLTLIVLFAGGYAITYMISASHSIFGYARTAVAKSSWWVRALAASSGLSIIYLLGGSLVEFTGNESIVPMLQKSASLGVIGLLWLLVVKISAIGWSKTMGYRGGLIFPSIFLASILVAILQHFVTSFGFTIGLIAVLAGLITANAKVKILF